MAAPPGPPARVIAEEVRKRNDMASSNFPVSAGSSLAERQDVDNLRAERDRFVALAFCNADLLFELDSTGEITFAAGATNVFTGMPAHRLNGMRLHDVVAEDDRREIERLLRDARAGRRIDNAQISMATPRGPSPARTLSGFHMSDLGGHTYIALRIATPSVTLDHDHLVRVEGSDVLDRGSFAEAASRFLTEAGENGDDCHLTMFELGEYQALRERLNEETRSELSATLGSFFRANSLHGDLAGQLEENRFGVLHRDDVDVTNLSRQIEDYARAIDPEGEGLQVSAATVDLDTGDMSSVETAKALVYTINRFCETAEGGDFTVRQLSDSFSSLAAETVEKRHRFAAMIRDGAFEIAFQPICDLRTGRPHHFEALVRFDHEAMQASPYEFITFAEEVGIIVEFDLAMCRKVLDWLEKTNGQGYRYMAAVNISGRSLSSPKFVSDLMALLDRAKVAREFIVFEVTESAKLDDLDKANTIIQALRKAGHIVCLDDFGAGVSAFQYLAALHVDVVKIDGAYVLDAIANKRGKALLKAMASMCKDLGVTTIAEMIEEKEVAQLCQDCGVDYGQGYLYGKPNKLISAFQSPRPVEFTRSRDAA